MILIFCIVVAQVVIAYHIKANVVLSRLYHIERMPIHSTTTNNTASWGTWYTTVLYPTQGCIRGFFIHQYLCKKINRPPPIYLLWLKFSCWGMAWSVLVWSNISLHYLNDNCFDVIMSAMASQITSVSIAYSTVCSGAGQRKQYNSAPMTFVRGIHRWLADSPNKVPVTQKIFPVDDVIMYNDTVTPNDSLFD